MFFVIKKFTANFLYAYVPSSSERLINTHQNKNVFNYIILNQSWKIPKNYAAKSPITPAKLNNAGGTAKHAPTIPAALA